MTSGNAPDHDDLVKQVTSAFEEMRVPPAPSARAIAAALALAGQARAELARAELRGATDAPDEPVQHRRRQRIAGQGRAGRFSRLMRLQTLAMGGVGLSIAAGLLLLLFMLTPGTELSAMERMARELREVTSYSYKIASKNSFVEEGKQQPTVVVEEGATYWRAPDGWHSEVKITRFDAEVPAGRVVEHFVEVFPAGKPGMFIDYKMKIFVRIPNEPIGSTIYPLDLLRMIRENSGEITGELGTKEIQGKQARGYVIMLKGFHEKRPESQVKDPVEVWVDVATDLPLEFGYEGTNESTYMFRATDFRWNVPLDPQLFVPTPPEGFDDITAPSGKAELRQITAALALFAALSGGHYPQQKKFDAAAIHDEMLRLAGFVGPPQPGWEQNEKFQRIQQARPGLDWIARILRNRYHAFYGGRQIGPEDKDKLLLWWRVAGPDLTRYCVVYGDLRTESLTEAQAEKLGLSDSWPNDEAENSATQ